MTWGYIWFFIYNLCWAEKITAFCFQIRICFLVFVFLYLHVTKQMLKGFSGNIDYMYTNVIAALWNIYGSLLRVGQYFLHQDLTWSMLPSTTVNICIILRNIAESIFYLWFYVFSINLLNLVVQQNNSCCYCVYSFQYMYCVIVIHVLYGKVNVDESLSNKQVKTN